LNIDELVHRAQGRGVELGKSPKRTVRYYIDLGILHRPEIEQRGKVRRNIYSEKHLVQLRLISELKKEGHSLAEIKEIINESLYWSDEGLEFMVPFIKANNIPPDEFRKGKPITKAEILVFLWNLKELKEKGEANLDIINKAFVDKNGKPIVIPQFLGENL
jgi:DNA-binding transcriptional MerR regulator